MTSKINVVLYLTSVKAFSRFSRVLYKTFWVSLINNNYKDKKNALKSPKIRASDISRGRGPAKFRYFCKIPRNSQKNQKYFQIHVCKTYLTLILAIRPVLFTPNVQIYLETSSLQRVNNVSELPGVLDERCEKLGTNHNVNSFSIRSFLERTVVERANDSPC